MKAHSNIHTGGREAQDSSVQPVNLNPDRFPVSKRQQAKARQAARLVAGDPANRQAVADQILSALAIFGGHVVAVVAN